jgi:hypothetical protein
VSVNPHRITVALNRAKLFGPSADGKLGAVEPDLDEWEAGRRQPSAAQLKRLSLMANVPLEFFSLPDSAPPKLSVGIICTRGRGRGCHVVVSMSDEPDRVPQPTLGILW